LIDGQQIDTEVVMYSELIDQRIVITGGARGIGFAIAEAFARSGSRVIIMDIMEDAVNAAVTGLREQGWQAYGYVGNVADNAGMDALFSQIVQEHERIDCLINNAGVTRDNLIMRMKEEEWHNVLSVNLNGTFYCTQKCFKYMMKQRYGSIINIASIIGLMGNAGQANYAASKGGIIAFTKSCAKEFAGRNIRVNAIAPGFIETEMTAKLPSEVVENYAKAIPLASMGKPHDVANLCLFLASNQSAYITGQTIAVDGGLTMH